MFYTKRLRAPRIWALWPSFSQGLGEDTTRGTSKSCESCSVSLLSCARRLGSILIAVAYKERAKEGRRKGGRSCTAAPLPSLECALAAQGGCCTASSPPLAPI